MSYNEKTTGKSVWGGSIKTVQELNMYGGGGGTSSGANNSSNVWGQYGK